MVYFINRILKPSGITDMVSHMPAPKMTMCYYLLSSIMVYYGHYLGWLMVLAFQNTSNFDVGRLLSIFEALGSIVRD